MKLNKLENVPRLRFSEFSDGWSQQPLVQFLSEFSEKSIVHDQHDVLTSSRDGVKRQSDYFGRNRLTERNNIGFNVIPPGFITYRSRSDDRTFYFNENRLGIKGVVSKYYPVFKIEGDNKFFLELLRKNSCYIGKHAVGTSQTVLSLKQLKRLTFPIPELEEQKKIGALFGTLEKRIEQ